MALKLCLAVLFVVTIIFNYLQAENLINPPAATFTDWNSVEGKWVIMRNHTEFSTMIDFGASNINNTNRREFKLYYRDSRYNFCPFLPNNAIKNHVTTYIPLKVKLDSYIIFLRYVCYPEDLPSARVEIFPFFRNTLKILEYFDEVETLKNDYYKKYNESVRIECPFALNSSSKNGNSENIITPPVGVYVNWKTINESWIYVENKESVPTMEMKYYDPLYMRFNFLSNSMYQSFNALLNQNTSTFTYKFRGIIGNTGLHLVPETFVPLIMKPNSYMILLQYNCFYKISWSNKIVQQAEPAQMKIVSFFRNTMKEIEFEDEVQHLEKHYYDYFNSTTTRIICESLPPNAPNSL